MFKIHMFTVRRHHRRREIRSHSHGLGTEAMPRKGWGLRIRQGVLVYKIQKLQKLPINSMRVSQALTDVKCTPSIHSSSHIWGLLIQPMFLQSVYPNNFASYISGFVCYNNKLNQISDTEPHKLDNCTHTQTR